MQVDIVKIIRTTYMLINSDFFIRAKNKIKAKFSEFKKNKKKRLLAWVSMALISIIIYNFWLPAAHTLSADFDDRIFRANMIAADQQAKQSLTKLLALCIEERRFERASYPLTCQSAWKMFNSVFPSPPPAFFKEVEKGRSYGRMKDYTEMHIENMADVPEVEKSSIEKILLWPKTQPALSFVVTLTLGTILVFVYIAAAPIKNNKTAGAFLTRDLPKKKDSKI